MTNQLIEYVINSPER